MGVYQLLAHVLNSRMVNHYILEQYIYFDMNVFLINRPGWCNGMESVLRLNGSMRLS